MRAPLIERSEPFEECLPVYSCETVQMIIPFKYNTNPQSLKQSSSNKYFHASHLQPVTSRLQQVFSSKDPRARDAQAMIIKKLPSSNYPQASMYPPTGTLKHAYTITSRFLQTMIPTQEASSPYFSPIQNIKSLSLHLRGQKNHLIPIPRNPAFNTVVQRRLSALQ
jgi:hypothetical protein